MNTAVLSTIVVAVVCFAGFCLLDIYRAQRVRYLPKWAWAVICLISFPLGGIVYLKRRARPSRPTPTNRALPRTRATEATRLLRQPRLNKPLVMQSHWLPTASSAFRDTCPRGDPLPFAEVLYVRQTLCWSQVATAPAALGTGSGDRLRAPQGSTGSHEGNKKGHLLAFSKAL